jgi:hypothetical protein
VVGETMKDTYTLLETIETSCGHTIIFRPELVGIFFKKHVEENFAKLTLEEQERCHLLDQQYGDLDLKLWKQPLQNLLNELRQNVNWPIQDSNRNPIEEYEHALSIGRDQDMSEEEHNLKMERLRIHKEWFEKQNQ